MCSKNNRHAAAMENSTAVPPNLNVELPCDAARPLVGIYPKEVKGGTQADICIFVFIATLFTIAKK